MSEIHEERNSTNNILLSENPNDNSNTSNKTP